MNPFPPLTVGDALPDSFPPSTEGRGLPPSERRGLPRGLPPGEGGGLEPKESRELESFPTEGGELESLPSDDRPELEPFPRKLESSSPKDDRGLPHGEGRVLAPSGRRGLEPSDGRELGPLPCAGREFESFPPKLESLPRDDRGLEFESFSSDGRR